MPRATKKKTSTPTPDQLARRIFELLNARNLDAMTEIQHPDVVDDFVAIGEFRGRAEVRAFFEEMTTAFPDFSFTVENVVADGRSAVLQWHGEGTFSGGPFLGLQPNGARVDLRGVDCMEFEDGLLRRNTVYYDGATLARAIGILPASGSRLERAMYAAFNGVTAVRRRV